MTRLLVNLTNSELLLFKEEIPEDKETRNYYMQIQTHRQQYKQVRKVNIGSGEGRGAYFGSGQDICTFLQTIQLVVSTKYIS